MLLLSLKILSLKISELILHTVRSVINQLHNVQSSFQITNSLKREDGDYDGGGWDPLTQISCGAMYNKKLHCGGGMVVLN